MTGERTKRFPLGLADLVRETRRRDTRPGDARAQQAGAGNGSPSKPGAGAKPGAMLVAKSTASAPFKASPAKPVNARPSSAKPVTASVKPTTAIKTTLAARNVASARVAPSGAATTPRPAATVTGAPGVALNGAHALTSERVRERMVERLRANGIADARVLQALAAVPRHMFVDPGLATQAYEDAALPIGHHQTISKPSVVARMLELAGAGRVLERVL